MKSLFPERKQIATMVDSNGQPIPIQPEKRYLLLISWNGEVDDWTGRYWKKVTGREEVIRQIFILRDDLIYDETFVCSETISLNKTWHLYTFLRFCNETGVWSKELSKELEGWSFDDIEQIFLDEYEMSQEELDEIYYKEVKA